VWTKVTVDRKPEETSSASRISAWRGYDASILKALLEITPKEGYSWVECGACSGDWKVLDFAEARVR
jgi:hypothetical protein